MKDHVKTSKYVTLEGELDDVLKELMVAGNGLVSPYVENTSWGGDPDYQVIGWRPMNEKELEKVKKERAKERDRKAKAKIVNEERERKEFERLREKYS